MHYKNIQFSYTQWFFFKRAWNTIQEVILLVSDIFWLSVNLFLNCDKEMKENSLLDSLHVKNPAKNGTSRFYVSEVLFFEVFGHKTLSD